jgi:hypothetical protein
MGMHCKLTSLEAALIIRETVVVSSSVKVKMRKPLIKTAQRHPKSHSCSCLFLQIIYNITKCL